LEGQCRKQVNEDNYSRSRSFSWKELQPRGQKSPMHLHLLMRTWARPHSWGWRLEDALYYAAHAGLRDSVGPVHGRRSVFVFLPDLRSKASYVRKTVVKRKVAPAVVVYPGCSFCALSILYSRSAARRRMTVRPWSFKRKTVPVCGLSRRWITP